MLTILRFTSSYLLTINMMWTAILFANNRSFFVLWIAIVYYCLWGATSHFLVLSMYQKPQKHTYCLLSGRELIEILQALSGIVKDLNAFAMYEDRKKSEKFKEEWIDSKRVMDILGIKRRALQNLRDNGIMPFSQVGGKFYYKVPDIIKLLESNYTCRHIKSPVGVRNPRKGN